MRTTIDIPDPLFRQAKARAAMEGKPLKEIVQRALQNELESPEGESVQVKKPPVLPLIPARKTGKIALTNREIEEYLFD